MVLFTSIVLDRIITFFERQNLPLTIFEMFFLGQEGWRFSNVFTDFDFWQKTLFPFPTSIYIILNTTLINNLPLDFLNFPSSASFNLFLVFFKHALQFLQQINVENVHLAVVDAGIRTYNLQNMSLFQ